MGSKGELNHRPDDWLDDWSNKNWLVDHPVADPGGDIGAALTSLLAVGEAIGTATTILGLRGGRHGQNSSAAEQRDRCSGEGCFEGHD